MSKPLSFREVYAQELARQLDTALMMNLKESILALANSSLQFIEDNLYTPNIQNTAKPQFMYFSVLQGTDDALRDAKHIYRLKHTSPKGGVYPFIDLPSFSIIPRASNTLQAYRKADYLKSNALMNASIFSNDLDLFDIDNNPALSEPNRIFLILDVYIESKDNAHLNFLLPSSDLKHIHLSISYDEILQIKSQPSEVTTDIQPATPKLKKILQDLDDNVNQG